MLHGSVNAYYIVFLCFFSGQNGIVIQTYVYVSSRVGGILSQMYSNNFFRLQSRGREYAVQGVLCEKGEFS